MTFDEVKKLVGLKVTKAGQYEDGFWLELADGSKVFIDS